MGAGRYIIDISYGVLVVGSVLCLLLGAAMATAFIAATTVTVLGTGIRNDPTLLLAR